MAAVSAFVLDTAALMARLAATGVEETEDEEMEEEEEEEDRREDRNPSNSSARATEDDSKSEDGEDDSKSEDGEDDSASAPPRVSLSSTRTAPPAIPPSVAFEVSSGADPPLSGSAVNDVPSAPVADEDSDGAFAATHIAHLRGQCIAELGVRRFARAYRIARRAAVAGAEDDEEERGEDGGSRGDASRGDARDAEIREDAAEALGEARGCAPLLEMLVTLEEVHRAAERGGADFASLARGLEARGLGVERVVGR